MGKREGQEGAGGVPCWYPFWNGGSWRYDFRVEGDRFRRSTGVRDPEALEIAIEIAKGVHDAAWARALSPYPTSEEAAHLYLAEFGKYQDAVQRLIMYFGPLPRVDEIDAFAIKKCKVDLKKPNWRLATVRKEITTPLKAVINNALGLRPEKREENARTRTVTPEEFKRLVAVAQDPPAAVRDPHRRLLKMIAFLIGSGATPGEMFCVRAEDINRATGEVRIRGEDPGAGKTVYRSRIVRLPVRAWDLMGELPSKGRVFLSTTGREIVPDGKRGSTVIRQFRKLCAATGLAPDGESEPLVFYSLRHTWATWFSAQVGDQDLLLDRGGWASADMARHYRKRAPADLGERLLAHGWDFRP